MHVGIILRSKATTKNAALAQGVCTRHSLSRTFGLKSGLCYRLLAIACSSAVYDTTHTLTPLTEQLLSQAASSPLGAQMLKKVFNENKTKWTALDTKQCQCVAPFSIVSSSGLDHVLMKGGLVNAVSFVTHPK